MPIAQPRSTWDSSKRATHLLLRLLFKLDGLKQLKEAPWPGCRKEKPVEPVEIVGKSRNLRFLVLKMELWKWEVELAVGCFVFYNSRGASSNASKVASLGRVKAWKPLFWRWDADQTWDETKKNSAAWCNFNGFSFCRVGPNWSRPLATTAQLGSPKKVTGPEVSEHCHAARSPHQGHSHLIQNHTSSLP